VKRALLAALFCVASPVAFAADDPSAIARGVGEKFDKACSAGDVDAVLALYRDDARVVYPGAGQTATTKAELRPIVAATCAKGGPKISLVGYRATWADAAHTVIAALGDWKMASAGPDGTPVDVPLRAVEVLVKTPHGWLYVADHASIGAVPSAPTPSAATH
jgi:ketosteroid isomerase-like protein